MVVTLLESSILSFIRCYVASSMLKFIPARISIALAVGPIVITYITFNTGIYTIDNTL